MSGNRVDDIQLTEKSIHLSPLTVILAVLALMLLSWILYSQYTEEEAWAPQADSAKGESTEQTAPVPRPDDG